MTNPLLPATTKQPGLPTPMEVVPTARDPQGIDPRTEAAADALVAAMADLRDSDLDVDEIRELIIRKIQSMEGSDGEEPPVSADMIVGEIEKELDEDVVIELPAAGSTDR